MQNVLWTLLTVSIKSWNLHTALLFSWPIKIQVNQGGREGMSWPECVVYSSVIGEKVKKPQEISKNLPSCNSTKYLTERLQFKLWQIWPYLTQLPILTPRWMLNSPAPPKTHRPTWASHQFSDVAFCYTFSNCDDVIVRVRLGKRVPFVLPDITQPVYRVMVACEFTQVALHWLCS